MKNPRYTFCGHLLPYIVLKVGNHSDKNGTHSPIFLKPVPRCTSDFDLSWRPDLLTYGVKICTQDVLLFCAQVPKTWRRCAPPLLSYSRKTVGGGAAEPALSGGRVKLSQF